MSHENEEAYIGGSERGCKLCIDCPKGACLHDGHTQKTVGGGSVRCCDNGDMDEGIHPTHITPTTEEGDTLDTLDAIVRGFTAVGGHSKSELRRRIEAYAVASYTRGREEGKDIAYTVLLEGDAALHYEIGRNKGKTEGAAAASLKAVEIIHEHFMESKEKNAMDVLEAIQAEILEASTPKE